MQIIILHSTSNAINLHVTDQSYLTLENFTLFFPERELSKISLQGEMCHIFFVTDVYLSFFVISFISDYTIVICCNIKSLEQAEVMVTCRVYPAGAKIGKCRMNLSGICDEFSSSFSGTCKCTTYIGQAMSCFHICLPVIHSSLPVNHFMLNQSQNQICTLQQQTSCSSYVWKKKIMYEWIDISYKE